MRTTRAVVVSTLCVGTLGIALVGCGAASGVEPAGSPKAATPSAEARRQLDNPRSAASTVVRFWSSIQDGALPLSLSLYEPRVVSAVGIATFAGMLDDQRATAKDARLNVLRVNEVAGGRLIRAETVPKVGAKARHSFFLRRVGTEQPDRWRIVYDTLSAAGIQSYVQSQTQRAIDPSSAPGRTALSAADRAVETYRRASLAPAPTRARAATGGQPSG